MSSHTHTGSDNDQEELTNKEFLLVMGIILGGNVIVACIVLLIKHFFFKGVA